MTDTPLPNLPKLSGDIAAEVYIHRSLGGGGRRDNRRLAKLGRSTVDLLVSNYVYHKDDTELDQFEDKKREYLNATNYKKWNNHYRLIWIASPTWEEKLHTDEESETLFYAYVGAVYVELGFDVCSRWILALIDPTWKSTPVNPVAPMAAGALGQVIPTSPQSNWVARINERCSQLHYGVEYPPPQMEGPSHNPRWTVTCLIQGVLKGTGSAAVKRDAKEEAARQAWIGMGWS